jgi:hypothetical protein
MTMTIDAGAPRQIWHAGFIVNQLEPAMDELSAALGLSWNSIHEIHGQRLDGPDGASWLLETRVAFSLDLPLSIELIEPSPGTPNVRRGDSAFHHLGFWADDLLAEEERLASLGYSCVMVRTDETALRRIVITDGPYDVLLEATNTLTARPGLEHFYPQRESR